MRDDANGAVGSRVLARLHQTLDAQQALLEDAAAEARALTGAARNDRSQQSRLVGLVDQIREAVDAARRGLPARGDAAGDPRASAASEPDAQIHVAAGQISRGIRAVTDDTEALGGAINETAAAMEQMSRSIKGVAANATELAAAAEETTASINESAASIEEVSKMSELLAAAVEENATAIEQVSRAVQGVASSADRIADAAGAASTAALQMDRSAQAVAGLAKQADEIARTASREAEDGGRTVGRSIEALARVRGSMNESAGVMGEMARRASDIGTIIDTIDVIAERTNLLSLNASIEAARAGDAGRGFAVVAEEIRTLAGRSADATAEIARIIKSLQEAVTRAVSASADNVRVTEESSRLAEEGAAGLQRILTGMQESSRAVNAIARATAEQLAAGQTVVAAVNTTAEQSRQVARGSAEQATSITGVVRATTQMRNTAREVARAMAEQGRAARDILKAGQNTAGAAAEVSRAMAEQARSAEDVTRAIDAMRRGAQSTRRALGEQATAIEQVVAAVAGGRAAGQAAEGRVDTGGRTDALRIVARHIAALVAAADELDAFATAGGDAARERDRRLRALDAAIADVLEHARDATGALASLRPPRAPTPSALSDRTEALRADGRSPRSNGGAHGPDTRPLVRTGSRRVRKDADAVTGDAATDDHGQAE